MQQGLGKMVGASSGFIESLPPRMRARIAFLESLQDKHDELEEKFDEEMLALEKKYEALYGEGTSQCAAACTLSLPPAWNVCRQAWALTLSPRPENVITVETE